MKNLNHYYKSFYDNSPIGFYTTDIQTGEFIMVNPACARILGYDNPKELLSSGIKSLAFYDKKARDLFIERAKNSGIADYEMQICVPGRKEKIWVSISATLCEGGECLQGSITDITQQKKMEEEIEDLRQSSIKTLKEIKKQAKHRLEKVNEELSFCARAV